MARWLVTGAGGMLGHDLVAGAAQAAGSPRDPRRPARTSTSPTPTQCVEPVSRATTSSSTAPPTPPSTPPRPTRRGASPSTRSARPTSPGRRTAPVPRMVHSPPTTSSPATPTRAVCRRRTPSRPLRLRPHQGRGRVGRAARVPRSRGSCAPRGSTARAARTSSTTMLRLAGRARDRSTVVDDQVGQPTWTVDLAEAHRCASSTADAPFGIWHGTGSGRVRRGSAWPGPSSRSSGSTPSGSADHDRRVPAAGAAAGLQRARPRHVAARRGSSRCRTGVRPCGGLPPPCWGG